nr:glycine cleavage system protein GcvH [candidate division Zixibacteria bacterium]
MNIPAGLKYTREHEWVKVDGKTVTVGITDYAQGELGDIVFVELPKPGAELKVGGAFGTIEAVKAVSDIFSPVTGKVLEANTALEDDPMVINRDPYGEGWMIKAEMANDSELNNLLSPEDYKNLIG